MHFAAMTSSWFAVALPMIVLMYLFKKQYDDTDISSHLLWQRVLKNMEANRPWQKLRHHILLYLQLLVAALIVLSLMQPYFWTSVQQAHHIMIIDQSASMSAYLMDENALQNEAETDSQVTAETRFARVQREVSEWLSQHAKGQPITIIGMGKQAEVLALRETDRQLLIERLENLQINYGRTAYDEALSLAASLAQNEEAIVHLYTDGQMNESIRQLAWSTWPNVYLIGQDEASNASIVQFGVRRDAGTSNTVTAVVTIKNWGSQSLYPNIILATDDGHLSEQQVELLPNEQKTIFIHDQPIASYYHLHMEVDDLLMADNKAFATLADEDSRQALLLTPGNMFLEKALQLGGVKILKSQTDPDGMMVMPQEDVDMIIVDRIDPEALASAQWQALLSATPVWYIGYHLAEHELAQPVPKYTISDHPIMNYIQMHDTHIAEVQVFADLGWGEAIVTADELPLIYAGHVNGWPRVVYTFDLHRSDLPLRAEFPVLVNNTAQWLASAQTHNLGTSIAGEVLELSLMTATRDALWQAVNDATFTLPVEQEHGAVSHLQVAPSEPGLYRLIEQNEQGHHIQERLLHVTMDPRESNLAQIASFATDESAIDEPQLQEDQSEHVVSQSLIPWLLMLLLVIVVTEWEVYRRGIAI